MNTKQELLAKRQVRNSSIELFKVIGIVLIVISHVVQTLNDTNTYITYDNYIVDLSMVTTNIQQLILSLLRYSGEIGNTIFFVCSCWFLLDSKKSNKRKIIQMVLDIWTISVLIFGIIYLLNKGNINIGYLDILKQFLPTTFSNNWYLSCYLIFYLIHPVLNSIINKMGQKALLRCTLISLFIYIIYSYIIAALVDYHALFSTRLTVFIAIYFVIAYMKLYLTDFSNNIKLNCIIALLGTIAFYGIIVITNFIGLRISFFENKVLMWNAWGSPILILVIICIFNVVKNIRFESKAINYVSKLSLLIYIIHENWILKTFYRPMLWQYVYTKFGYDYILGWALILVAAVFAFGFLASVLYQQSIQKLVMRISDKLYFKLVKFYGYFEKILLQLR
jgi:surface polysaccharide O-acyltransferase-like enzyme